MNISTYESRIKALEDQLNPPAPGGSTGLLSVVVTPDITLSDGTSLNAKLAELVPVGFGDMIDNTWVPLDGELTEGDEHSVTITPDSESYVVNIVDGEMVFGEKGAPVTVSVAVRKATGGLSFGVDAKVASNSEEVPPPKENLAKLNALVKKTNIN